MSSNSSSSSSFVCPADNRTFTETTGIEFQEIPAISNGHLKTPRFGHSRNVTAVIESIGNAETEREQTKDYLIGAVSASIGMFAFFACWMIMLLLFKCAGPKRVGFFSGSRVTIPAAPADLRLSTSIEQKEGGGEQADFQGGDDYVVSGGAEGELERLERENHDKAVRAAQRRMRRIRITVLICGAIIVAMCITMIIKGVAALGNSFGSIRDGFQQADDLTLGGVEIIDNFMESQSATFDAAQTVDVSASTCPPVANVICSTLLNLTNNDNTDGQCLPEDEIQSFVIQAREVVSDQLTKTRQDLMEVSDIIDDIDSTAARYEWAFYVAAAVAALLAVLTIAIMSGVILAWTNNLKGNCCQKFASCLRGWCLVPIYTFLVVLGWAFSMAFVIGSTVTADFCFNSPDQNVILILDKLKDQFGSLLFQLLVFYISGCPAGPNNVKDQIRGLLEQALAILGTAQPLVSGLKEQAGPAIVEFCGTEASDINAATTVLQNQICTIRSSLYDVGDFLSCANWNTLYATVAYDAVCYNATTGFSWIATTQFIIVFFSMIILTLRVAFYELEDEEEIAKQRQCVARFFCGCCGGGGTSAAAAGAGNISSAKEGGVAAPEDVVIDDQQVAVPNEDAIQRTN